MALRGINRHNTKDNIRKVAGAKVHMSLSRSEYNSRSGAFSTLYRNQCSEI